MLHLPLRTVNYILNEFEKKLVGYKVQNLIINPLEKVLLIEDSLALYVGKLLEDPRMVCLNVEEMYGWTKCTDYMDMPVKGADYYLLAIEELTYNTLGFKYNHSKLMREIEAITKIQHLSLDVSYTKFKGYTRLYWCPEVETLVEEMEKKLPELQLRQRYEAWEGLNYYFVIMKFVGANEQPKYAVAYTTQKPYTYINNLVNKWLKDRRMIGYADMLRTKGGFYDAIFLLKGMRFKDRFEQNLSYTSVEKFFREKDDVWRYADKILDYAYENRYADAEWSSYLKPVNKWTTEELVFKYTQKLYKQYNVIYQHRPFFLKTEIGGQMSYDVYIAGLNVAIEYQGKQHFEPVEFFGGEEAFKKTVERDKLKKELSQHNGVKLVYINYWDNISLDLIRQRISEI